MSQWLYFAKIIVYQFSFPMTSFINLHNRKPKKRFPFDLNVFFYDNRFGLFFRPFLLSVVYTLKKPMLLHMTVTRHRKIRYCFIHIYFGTCIYTASVFKIHLEINANKRSQRICVTYDIYIFWSLTENLFLVGNQI